MSKQPVKIRERHRILASPPAGHRQSWDEWQVVEGRKVIGRFDFRHQAERFCNDRGLEFIVVE